MLNLKKLLTKVLTAVTVTEGTGTVASIYSSASVRVCRLTKVGNVVHMQLSLYVNSTTNLTQNESLFNIPAAFRPKSRTSVPAVLTRTESNGGVLPSALVIETNGNILMTNGAVRGAFCSATWTI